MQQPTVYDHRNVYDNGGGGGGGFIIPDGYILYESITNTSTFSSTEKFNFPVGKYNDEIAIYIECTLSLSNPGNKIKFFLAPESNEYLGFMYENFNGGIYTTLNNGKSGSTNFATNYISNGVKCCYGIFKDQFIDFYTKDVKKTNISYERKFLTSLNFLNTAQTQSANLYKVHKIFLLDNDGNYVNLFIPSKDVNNKIGFLDVITGNFITNNSSVWAVDNRIYP